MERFGKLTAKIYFEERKEEADDSALSFAKIMVEKLEAMMNFEDSQPHFDLIGQHLWPEDYEDIDLSHPFI